MRVWMHEPAFYPFKMDYYVFDCVKETDFMVAKGLPFKWMAVALAVVMTKVTGNFHDYDGVQANV